jgi:hypothetical protein
MLLGSWVKMLYVNFVGIKNNNKMDTDTERIENSDRILLCNTIWDTGTSYFCFINLKKICVEIDRRMR